MSRGEVGDTLQYFEASSGKNSSSGNGKKRFDRTQSSNALHPRPGIGGLNPKALFSVAAMATAPVGTTVIEDDPPELEEEIVMMSELSSANKSLLDNNPEAEDLCEQCTKKRQARILRQQKDQNQRLQEDDQDDCDSNVNRDASLTATPVNQVEASQADEKMKGSSDTSQEEAKESVPLRPPKVPPPRPPRTRVPLQTSQSKNEELESPTPSPPASASAVFTITTNPISSEANEDATIVKKLPDYCLPAEDSMCVTPPEIALLQKRIPFRRMLPCLNFEDLERERMEMDESRLELVDSRLAEAHRVVMQRTANRYLVMEAATFGDKLFTGTLIIITILAILVLFWFRNFGPELVKHVVDSVDHL